MQEKKLWENKWFRNLPCAVLFPHRFVRVQLQLVLSEKLTLKEKDN